ncbi:MAG: DUF2142 domain-containing protein [Clostridiales bacterium]|nr:DUF2142 domain-containing protein [Clostridiales bacterium]
MIFTGCKGRGMIQGDKGFKSFRGILIIAVLGSFFLSILVCHASYGSCLEIFYYGNNSSSYTNSVAEVYWDDGSGFSEDHALADRIQKRQISFTLPLHIGQCTGFRIDFTSDTETISIASVRIRNGWRQSLEFTAEQLTEYGDFYNVSELQAGEGYLTIVPENDDPIYILNPDALEQLKQSAGSDSAQKWFYLCLIWSICVIFLAVCFFYIKKEDKESKFAVWTMLLFFAGAAVLYMAFFSVTFGHPDEDETSYSVDYYLQAWSLPDFSSEKLYNAFSNYGTTRLKELSVYYFLAGKVGFVFKQTLGMFNYYRIFGVILFVVLIFLFIKYGKKNPWLILPIGMTPQVWYLFSYATSDAWDFFLAFVLIAACCIPNGHLQKSLDQPLNGKRCVYLIFIGFLYGLLFMGKSTYYTVFLLAAAIFIFYLTEKRDKKLIPKYVIIVGACLLTFGVRKWMDYRVYGTQKSALYQAARENHISEAILNSVSYRDQGLSFSSVFTEGHFARGSFQSFVGKYGWMSESSGTAYYIIMGILYAALISSLICLCVREYRARPYAVWKDMILLFIIVLSPVISAYHSWNADFQAQGRYLFPMLFGIMYLVYRHRNWMKRKTVQILISAVMVLSLYSFVRCGILPLTVG